MPTRIQLKRSKGWRLPANTVNVARPGKWGNPFKITEYRSGQEAVDLYNWWIKDKLLLEPEFLAEIKAELGDKNLACWCTRGGPCHANILLGLANSSEATSDGPDPADPDES